MIKNEMRFLKQKSSYLKRLVEEIPKLKAFPPLFKPRLDSKRFL